MDFFGFFSRKQSSKDVAKSRLKFVLAQDRLNISSHVLDMMKTDILKVISNYVDIDDTDLDISVTQDGANGPMIVANIPVKDMRRVNA